MGKGSTWNIWDFHLHTPFSVLNNQYGSPEDSETWEKYVNTIEAKSEEHHIAAIGLTDYFCIEGYKKVLEYKNEGRLKNIYIFPNIEFRIDKVIYRDINGQNPKRLNFHVIFSPDVKPDDIEEDFLRNLKFVYENEPFEPNKGKNLTVRNLTKFGEQLRKQHQHFADKSAFEVGCLNAVVSVDQIKEMLFAHFKGNFLLVLADEDLSLLNWNGQDHGTRKHLIQMSHAVFASNPGTIDFCLGKRHPTIDVFLDEFKSLKPCIWGCDSHGFVDRFLKPDEKRFCWIKADITWNGLKQILYEPENRVRIQENNPEENKSIYSITDAEIPHAKVNQYLSIDDTKIAFNPNLVTIIGGRGSGKTALLDLIATCFKEGNKLSQLNQSFIHRLYGDDRKKTSENLPLSIDLTFASGDRFQKWISRDKESKVFDKTNIIYLTQNHFDEFSAYPDRLNEHIITLVFDKFREEKIQFDSLSDEMNKNELEIQKLNLRIEQLKNGIEGKKEETQSDLARKIGEKRDNERRITEIESKQGRLSEELKMLADVLDKIQHRKRNIESLIYKLNNFRNILDMFSKDFRNQATAINDVLKILFDYKPPFQFPIEIERLSALMEQVHDANDLAQKINYENDLNLEKQKASIDELEGMNKTIAELHKKSNNIALEISQLENLIKQIENTEAEILQLENERFDRYKSTITRNISLRLYLQEIIDLFEKGQDTLLNNLEFTALIDCNEKNQYLQNILDKVDNRKHNEQELHGYFAEIFGSLEEVLNSDVDETKIQKIVDGLKTQSTLLKLKKSTSLSDFYNSLLKSYFHVGFQVKFNGKILGNLSMGERAIVLLKILMALDDKPLLIDQPEEHLDNRYIYNELMPAFREAKRRRQIIIATHNANLVVNTDAEQIIVANNSDGCITYREGTLENKATRDDITSILEGGDKAFKKREEKYGFII